MAYTRRLYKSSGDKVLSGVAGGMAEYFEIDPVFVRLGWFASVFVTGGISILVYIVMVIVVPRGGYASPSSADVVIDESSRNPVESEATMRERNERRRYLLGIFLVVAGIALLMYNLNFFGFINWGVVDWGIVGAISVIAVGAAMIYRSVHRRN